MPSSTDRLDIIVRSGWLITYNYQLPFKSENDIMNKMLGGWAMNGVVTLQNGLPHDHFGPGRRNYLRLPEDRRNFQS